MSLLEVLVWLGTLTFAATGALLAVRLQFDLLGVLVLAAVTAIGGGSIRDVLVGILPPAALQDEALLWGIALTGLIVFFLHPYLHEGKLLYALDTLGLALFAALGAERGVSAGLGMWGVIFMGAVSGVGGGVLRDLLTGKVPGILYRNGDFYASAAAVGALSVYLLYSSSSNLALVTGAFVTLILRIGSRLLGLKLPVPRSPDGT